MLEAVLSVCNQNARIPACGMISQYNVPDKEGVKNLFAVRLASHIITPVLPLHFTVLCAWTAAYLGLQPVDKPFKSKLLTADSAEFLDPHCLHIDLGFALLSGMKG